MDFISNSRGHIYNFCQIMYFLPKKMVFQEEGGIKYDHKTDTEKGGGVWQMLTMADIGWRGLWGNADNG